MMLMSWGGETVEDVTVPNLPEEIYRTSRALWQVGVFHGGERRPTMLWNEERRRVMYIDFDRSTFLQPTKHKKLLALSEGGQSFAQMNPRNTDIRR